jgi:hypothetical protein
MFGDFREVEAPQVKTTQDRPAPEVAQQAPDRARFIPAFGFSADYDDAHGEK